MDRFIVVSSDEARRQELPGWDCLHQNGSGWHWCLYETDGEKPIRLVGEDGGEPEDQFLTRDLAWVPVEMNKLAEKIKELEIRVDELEEEIGNIHENGGLL